MKVFKFGKSFWLHKFDLPTRIERNNQRKEVWVTVKLVFLDRFDVLDEKY
jgi:hypothetical protein